MKDVRLYNLIFPLWAAMFLPPWVFIIFLGNLLIDGLIVSLGLRFNGVVLEGEKKVSIILRTWMLGFAADLIGAVFLFACLHYLTPIFSFREFTIWDSPATIILFSVAIILSSLCIFFFNRWNFRKGGIEEKVGFRVALSLAILTAPYMFLIPTPMSGF